MEQKRIDQKLKALMRKAERFNEQLFGVRKLCGTMEVYLDKSSTLISSPEVIEPIVCNIHDNKLTAWQSNPLGREDWLVQVVKDEDGEEYFEGAYEFATDIDWMRKCVNNGLKFYQSEEPDRFLESNEDEDE